MLIVIEGPDGGGKTTVAKKLAELLPAKWIEFPDRSTVTGQIIDRFLRHELGLGGTAAAADLSAVTLQSLFLVNRLEKLPELEAGLRGPHVVCSRYMHSGLVYGELDGCATAWLEMVHRPIPEPDLSILLDVPSEIGLARSGKGGELYEKLKFQRRVRQRYLDLWEERRASGNGRYVVVDATQSLDAVLETCLLWYETRRRSNMRG